MRVLVVLFFSLAPPKWVVEKQIHLRKIIVAIEMSGSCRKNESLVWNALLLLCVNLYVSTSKAQKTPIL